MNRNSNTYTVIYATVLTVLVAILLTVAAVGLAPQQKANKDNEKKQQILSSISSVLGQQVTMDNAAEIWSQYNMDQNKLTVGTDGQIIGGVDPFEIAIKAQFKGGVVSDDAQLPVFVAQVNGQNYYIMSLYGAGLWGPIWGYISVGPDGSTIAGACFDHDSETAGLGALIKDDPNFALSFVGKHVYKADGEFAPVQVLKAGKNTSNGADKVDAISGATKTTTGVSHMIGESLAGYQAFLAGVREPAQAPATDSVQVAADSINVEPITAE